MKSTCYIQNICCSEFWSLEIENDSLKKQLKEIKERNKRDSNENSCNERLKQSLKRFLNDNQIEYLNHGNSRTYPIPSYSILMGRLQNISFNSGIQEELIKIASTSIHQGIVHCSSQIDEMQIRPAITYDPGLKTFSGYIDKVFMRDNRKSVATHLLVFMLRSLISDQK